MNKKKIIDGLPASYDFNYVVKTHKRCMLCHSLIKMSEIDQNEVACTESFDFIHKSCVYNSNQKLEYAKKNDYTSMVRLLKIKNDEKNQPLSI